MGVWCVGDGEVIKHTINSSYTTVLFPQSGSKKGFHVCILCVSMIVTQYTHTYSILAFPFIQIPRYISRTIIILLYPR